MKPTFLALSEAIQSDPGHFFSELVEQQIGRSHASYDTALVCSSGHAITVM